MTEITIHGSLFDNPETVDWLIDQIRKAVNTRDVVFIASRPKQPPPERLQIADQAAATTQPSVDGVAAETASPAPVPVDELDALIQASRQSPQARARAELRRSVRQAAVQAFAFPSDELAGLGEAELLRMVVRELRLLRALSALRCV